MTTDTAFKVRRLADCFAEAPMGSLVTFEQLSVAIEEDIKTRRYLVYNALKIASKESGAQFKTVHKKGYQRLHSDELTKIGQSARKRVRRTVRLASQGIENGFRVANDLKPDQVNAILREQSALGVIEHFSKDKNVPVVPATDKRPLTPGQTAKAFLESVGAIKPTTE